MPTPDDNANDEQLAALLASTAKDAPPPDRAILERLREESLLAFRTATPTTLRKPAMIRSYFRWAAAVAAMLAVGVVLAQWIARINAPPADIGVAFLIDDSLIDDGRIGKITDAQGIVSIKPVLHERWSPVQSKVVLKPGDWLRTDARGANAVALALLKSTNVIVGPHSTVELVKPGVIHLLAGEIEITAAADAPVELRGPDQQLIKIAGKQFFRIVKEKLVRIAEEPRWLAGFKGTTANESLGSLIATVDGRNVPLTVGYHHITIDIRDQIARTTIEESFVNRTDAVLEGVFHFPLPQDASISGFGMWIGDKLVEADVVEKQRAREIYETILREKRDPGLLEWAGGNIFKARVYPIPAHAEKRIKITYTQVLPLSGNRYRYSYALQSELLKQHPLRDLSIDLTVNSSVPLKSVASPTHPARIAKTEHSGHVEYAAQEYTPSRDFEAVIELENRQSDVIVIPHRRGDDGYFMVQLTPPGAAGDWERPLVPNGDPLHLLLLADTSASMDAGQRMQQNAVLSALLGALTPKDTINVAACDVNCDWIFEKPVPAMPANVATIEQALAKRASLGWTDLDKAFASALKTSDAGTHVIYIGDGIATTGDADPVGFAKRLHQLYEGHAGTFHAIAVGSSFEPAALKAIASLGGGSLRRVTGERGPQAVALELLSEIATPGLRDLRVSFTGIRTARVYPEQLPNLPPGTQQILLGRYLPEGPDQSGEIIVTGSLGGKPVRYASKISLKDAEQGNAFIPRLWARMHLDQLLEQGTSETVKQEIIALSEEFNIITPYTSLLVLETDADRERFAVKRRYQMRDGEKFFADGKDTAYFELKQKQMKLAGDYRTALRRNVLAQLLDLGRDKSLFESSGSLTAISRGKSPGQQIYFGALGDFDADVFMFDKPQGYPMKGLGVGNYLPFEPVDMPSERKFDGMTEYDAKRNEFGGGLDDSKKFGRIEKLSKAIEEAYPESVAGSRGLDRESFGVNSWGYEGVELSGLMSEPKPSLLRLGESEFGESFSDPELLGRHYRGNYGYRPSQLLWLNSLFPAISAPPGAATEPKTNWPAPALALSRSLLRMEKLAQQKGGIAIARQFESFDSQRNILLSRSRRLELVSPTAWLGRTTPDGGPVTLSWCDDKEFGTASMAFLLGRVRASTKLDLARPPLELSDDSMTPLHESHAEYAATVEAIGPDRALLILKHKDMPESETRYLIDTSRHVILSVEQRYKGKVNAATKLHDFVEVASVWWARRIEKVNDKGQREWLATQTIAEVPAAEFAKRMTQELAGRSKVLFLHSPLPSVTAAKTAVAAGKASFDERAVLTMHFAATQQWARAKEHLQECERLAGSKPGMRWLVNAFLQASRRHEELRKRLLEDAAALANAADAEIRANDHYLAEHLFNQGQQVLQTNEMLILHDNLQAIAERQPAHLQAVKAWKSRRVTLLLQAGEFDKALPLSKAFAVEFPRDQSLQYQYAQNLASSGDYPGAYAWLSRVLEAKWETSDEHSLRGLFVQFLQQQGRYREMADYLAAWLERNPEGEQPYEQYLIALVRSNRAAKAETLAAQWLREAQVPGELPRPAAARLGAAISFALGQGYNNSNNIVEERWHAPLAEAALFFARREERQITSTILQYWRFQSTDAATAVRKALAAMLRNEIDTLSAVQIDSLLGCLWYGNAIEVNDCKVIAERLRKRWDAEQKPEIRHSLGQSLIHILNRLGGGKTLAFLRVEWQNGPAEYRVSYANELFSMLLSQPWTAEIEGEALALLDKLAAAEEPAAGLISRIAALYRFTDAMLEGRYQALMKKLKHSEKLTRIELQKKQEENRKLSQEGLADQFQKEAAKTAAPFANWLLAERLWIELRLERDLPKIAAECWKLLDTAPAKANPQDRSSLIQASLDEVLRQRFLVMLENITARKGADAALVERLLKFIDKQMTDHPDDGRWRGEKYRMLIALDQPKKLEAELRLWTGEADPDNRWRVALGYLLAEQGKVADAIKLFEAVEAADELSPSAYRSLAGWYLVENRKEQHEKASAAVYKTMAEDRLREVIGKDLRPWFSAGHVPTKLDPEVLQVFKVLFEKSEAPAYHFSQLQAFYQASHDFRLLSMLADAIIGQSAGKVYSILGGIHAILIEVRDEATADELVARIIAVRAAAKTPIDLRALDLLEVLVESRACDLQNQPGPHAQKALAALVRAFQREWAPGEPRLMADFLGRLGSVPQDTIATEQLRELSALHRGAAKGSFDRLCIAQRLAERLQGYSRHAEAMDALEAALGEYQETQGGVLPVSAQEAFGVLIAFTESARHFDRGEKLLLTQLTHPLHAEQKHWLIERLNALYMTTLLQKGEVSLGRGATLYKAVERKIIADCNVTTPGHTANLIGQLANLYRTAHGLAIAGVADDLKAFADKALPPLLQELPDNYQRIVQNMAQTTHDVASPRDGIAFLLDCVEHEPDWQRYSNENAWARQSYQLGEWRNEVKDLGDLEPRLLRYVQAELRRDLHSREAPNRTMYSLRGNFYWAAKEADFAKAAEEVYAVRKNSSASVESIAEYLFWGVHREKRAIDILFTAQRQKLLGDSGQWQLVEYLHLQQRHAESIPLLLSLVESQPENLGYRTKLLHAYYRTGKQNDLLALLKQSDAFFHEKDRWNEGPLAALAKSCLENHLFAQSAAYYSELIPLHQRTAPHRGIGDGTLSVYYSNAAQAYAGLGKTQEAVEMASAAVVSWGPAHGQRRQTLDSLVQILAATPDLAAYVAALDKEKLQSAIVRKAIGQAYLKKNDFALAIRQLRLAAELQPNDAEILAALVECFDKVNDKEGAVRQLLQSVELSRRDIKLYEQLGNRLADLQQPIEAERAYTSIVELLANESESHALLAEIREKQNRWADAIAEWQRVAAIRALEPTGLLRMAKAQIHEKQWDQAAESLRRLHRQSWPQRFTDTLTQIREMEKAMTGPPGK